jgi:hypothetical protein
VRRCWSRPLSRLRGLMRSLHQQMCEHLMDVAVCKRKHLSAGFSTVNADRCCGQLHVKFDGLVTRRRRLKMI